MRLTGVVNAPATNFGGEPVEGLGGAQILVEEPAGNVVEPFEPKAR